MRRQSVFLFAFSGRAHLNCRFGPVCRRSILSERKGKNMATPIAALIYRGEGDDELRTLWRAVGQLRDRGFSIKGLLNKTDAQGGKMRDRVCSLTDSREYAIMYDGGCTEDTCKLDPRGLAASSEVIREALQSPPDILVFNKFGHAESEGSGLIDEYAQAVAAGIPVISLLQDKYLPQWREFTDGMGTELENGLQGVLDWAQAQKGRQDAAE